MLPMSISQEIYIFSVYIRGHCVAQLVESLRYKPEGRGFDCQFFIYIILDSPSVDCLEIWEPQPPGILWACAGMAFTFTYLHK